MNELCQACNGTGLKDNFTLCPECGGTPSAFERAKQAALDAAGEVSDKAKALFSKKDKEVSVSEEVPVEEVPEVPAADAEVAPVTDEAPALSGAAQVVPEEPEVEEAAPAA
jgi:hypothetical protein